MKKLIISVFVGVMLLCFNVNCSEPERQWLISEKFWKDTTKVEGVIKEIAPQINEEIKSTFFLSTIDEFICIEEELTKGFWSHINDFMKARSLSCPSQEEFFDSIVKSKKDIDDFKLLSFIRDTISAEAFETIGRRYNIFYPK